jgi:hypothetical protein
VAPRPRCGCRDTGAGLGCAGRAPGARGRPDLGRPAGTGGGQAGGSGGLAGVGAGGVAAGRERGGINAVEERGCGRQRADRIRASAHTDRHPSCRVNANTTSASMATT